MTVMMIIAITMIVFIRPVPYVFYFAIIRQARKQNKVLHGLCVKDSIQDKDQFVGFFVQSSFDKSFS